MDEFTVFIIVVAVGFHLFLCITIVGYICYKDCRGKSCSCPCSKSTSELEEEVNVSADDIIEQERPQEQNSGDFQQQREQTHVNVYFTNRWVSSLANRIQTFMERNRSSNSESTPTKVVTGNTIDSEDDDNEGLPSYNEALSSEIDYYHCLSSPPSYEELFVNIPQTKI